MINMAAFKTVRPFTVLMNKKRYSLYIRVSTNHKNRISLTCYLETSSGKRFLNIDEIRKTLKSESVIYTEKWDNEAVLKLLDCATPFPSEKQYTDNINFIKSLPADDVSNEYRVEWRIELSGKTPEEAAKTAFTYLCDLILSNDINTTCFTVIDQHGNEQDIEVAV